jgi:thiosulfate dehydrogenase [quinone] large subunit
MATNRIITNPPLARFLFENTRSSWLWFVVRIYLGYAWLTAGIGKVGEAAWTGENAGAAVRGFVSGALEKTGGAHPDVQGWYATFLEAVVIPNAEIFGHIIAWGEVLVGIALIIGIFTGIAAFFGLFMNLNFLLAGTVSINPVLFVLGIGVVLAWKVAGYYGIDRWLLPKLGTPWRSS